MYSWRTIRTFCVVLLCLPLLHLAYLASRDVLATLDSSPDAWLHEIQAYTDADRQATLPKNPVVVLGGRRVKLWEGLDDMLAPQPVLMRGFGDATIEDVVHHYERLAAFYSPSAVIFLPGGSEFHIRDSKSETDFMQALRELAALDAEHGKDRPLVLFAPIKTPLRPGDHEKIQNISDRMAEWAAGDARIKVIDANPLLASADGGPNAAFFRPDGSSLNDAGYLRLALPLKTLLESKDGR
jgi:hypothetical protein